jgi:hypothetical protein
VHQPTAPLRGPFEDVGEEQNLLSLRQWLLYLAGTLFQSVGYSNYSFSPPDSTKIRLHAYHTSGI